MRKNSHAVLIGSSLARPGAQSPTVAPDATPQTAVVTTQATQQEPAPITPRRRGRPAKPEGALSSTERSRMHRQKKAKEKIAEEIDKIATTGDTGGRLHGEEAVGIDIAVIHGRRTSGDVILHRQDPEEVLLPAEPAIDPDVASGSDVRKRAGNGIGHESVGHRADEDEPANSGDEAKGERETDGTFMRHIRFPLNWGLTPEEREGHTWDFVTENFEVTRDKKLEQTDLGDWVLKPEFEDTDEDIDNATMRCKLCSTGGVMIISGEQTPTAEDWDLATRHIELSHKKKLWAYLKDFAPGRVKRPKCPAAYHDKLRAALPAQADGKRCDVCGRVILRAHIASKNLTNVKRPKYLKKDPVDRGDLG